MPKAIENAYEKYMAKVRMAQKAGYSDVNIVKELERERATIMPRCVMKQAQLSQDRNIYKSREAARAARECITAIDRIIEELQAPKEITA